MEYAISLLARAQAQHENNAVIFTQRARYAKVGVEEAELLGMAALETTRAQWCRDAITKLKGDT